MSIGNINNEGNKGNNFPWQLRMLNGQQCACDELMAIAANTDGVEFLLTSILTSLQAQTDYEARFVLETCPGAPETTRVLLEVRIWDVDSATWGPITYYLPGSTTPVTIGPLCAIEYTDPNSFLAQILTELQLQTPILTDIEFDTSAIAINTAAIDGSIDVNLSTVATQATLAVVETNTTGVARTPGIIRPTGAGNVNTVAANFFSVSVANVGLANGTVLGATIKPSEVLNFSGDALNNFFTSFDYDATATEFLITYIY